MLVYTSPIHIGKKIKNQTFKFGISEFLTTLDFKLPTLN